jgi:hypothetical protein
MRGNPLRVAARILPSPRRRPQVNNPKTSLILPSGTVAYWVPRPTGWTRRLGPVRLP